MQSCGPVKGTPTCLFFRAKGLFLFSLLFGLLGATALATDDMRIPPRPLPMPGEAMLPERFYGLPLVPEFVSVVPLAGRQVLLLPVLMDEPQVPIGAALLDPLQWETRGAAELTVGRRSLWFMEPGSTMLYAVLVDPEPLRVEAIGVAYLFVTRLDEARYDVVLETPAGEVLLAARGSLQILDETVGAGTLIPLEDAEQREVRTLYGARWNVGPEALFLFGYPGSG